MWRATAQPARGRGVVAPGGSNFPKGASKMRSRRFIGLAMMAAIVLAVAGIAVAHDGSGSGKTEAASATFTATPTDQTKTATCTGADGTYAITKGVYTGTSTGDPRLT